VVERQGKVEFARKGSSQWSLVQSNEVLQIGDRLRTSFHSRATLRWSELAIIRVDELTSMEIQPPAKPGAKPELELKSGANYFFSREKPEDIQFRTPVASGAIRGTEFNLKVAEDGRTELALLHGEVALNNAQGAATLSSGEQSTVEPGKAPTKAPLVDAINVIQWTLYYPIVVDPAEQTLSDADQQAIGDSLVAYRQGDLRAALAGYPENREPASDNERVYRAALLLAAGKPDVTEAELKKVKDPNPGANALRELMAAVKHKPSPATPTTATASESMASSYYHQSRGDLSAGREAALAATRKSPSFGAAWIRLAELEFGFGHTDRAREALNKGLALSPRNAEGLSLQGFVLSAQNHRASAMASFDKAIAIDGSLPDAWLGRGLLKIETEGHVVRFLPDRYHEGLKDLQVAAALAPDRAVLRSYLGKGFSDAYDPRRARKELDLATQLDPNDPTAWLYLALLNQQENRINEAVSDLEKSKELNQNRSLFRSQLLLDQDEAVRGANLASIYRDVGMFDFSAQEASRAVDLDYANYSAHLFLANSYDALRDPKLRNLRFETPWFSELLVANLLMPVGGGNLSQNISQQEYSRFFASDSMGVFSSTEYQSHGDWLQQGSLYGNFGNFGYSLDGTYRWQSGYRTNNDFEQQELDARFKQQITDKDSIFMQVGYFRADSGDVAQYYDQASASSTVRISESQEPNLLAGYHREWSPGNHTLALFSRIKDDLTITDPDSGPLAHTFYTFLVGGTTFTNDFLWRPNSSALDYNSTLEAYSIELQQIWETPRQSLIVGSRYQFAWADTTSSIFRPGAGPFGTPIAISQSIDSELDRFSIYGYEHFNVCDSLQLIGGVSYDRLHYPLNIDVPPISSDEDDKDKVSPKGGVLWTPWKDGNFRAAYSQSLGGVFFDQSVRLEPVQLAGFNQAFRSAVPESVAGLVPATSFETYGGGYDQIFKKTGTYFLVQGEFLNSDATRTLGILTNNPASADPLTPSNPSNIRQDLDFKERSFVAAVNQLVGKDVSIGARYKMTDADLTTHSPDIPANLTTASFVNQDVSATLHQVWLYALFQHESGFFAQFDTVWSQQSNRGYSPDIPGDDFWQYNLWGGYRFLQRRAELRLGLLNIGNRDYKLNPLTLYNELPRQRTLVVSLKLDF
jgi:tetratricopeptide (TPR) repeat protein